MKLDGDSICGGILTEAAFFSNVHMLWFVGVCIHTQNNL